MGPLSIGVVDSVQGTVVIAAHVWCLQWFRQHILFRSDNEAVVNMLNSRMSKVPCLMFLLHKLLFAAVRSNFTFVPSMYEEFTTQSLMLFLTFITRSSGAWLWKPSLFQWTSLNRFWRI